MRLLNPEYIKMYEVLKKSFEKNLPKVLLTVFLCLILKTVSVLFVSTPASSYRNFLSEGFSVNLVTSTALFLFSLVIVNIFDFGLVHYLTEAVIKRDSSARGIFKGFAVPSVWAGAVLFSIIEALSFVLALLVLSSSAEDIVFFIFRGSNAAPEMLAFFKSIVISFAYIAFSVLLKVPFVFAWNIINENNREKLFHAFLKSLKLFFPRMFHFIGFVIYINYKNFILYATFFTAEIFLESGILGFVISFAAFVQLLMITLKSYASRPVYYYSLLSVNGLIGEQVNTESGDDTDESSS